MNEAVEVGRVGLHRKLQMMKRRLVILHSQMRPSQQGMPALAQDGFCLQQTPRRPVSSGGDKVAGTIHAVRCQGRLHALLHLRHFRRCIARPRLFLANEFHLSAGLRIPSCAGS